CVLVLTATATTDLYTLSLHDALPIWPHGLWPYEPLLGLSAPRPLPSCGFRCILHLPYTSPFSVPDFREPNGSSNHRSRYARSTTDRKSTRLNSSHVKISYAVFCLKKK